MARKCCRSRALDRLDAEDWGHWGQWGHQQRRGFRCPHVPSPRWGQLGANGDNAAPVWDPLVQVPATCPHCPQCPHRKCAGFDATPYACGSGRRSNGCGCQHLRRMFAPAAARRPWRIAVRWPDGSRARLRYRMACTRTGRSVPGFHRHGQTLSLQSFHQTLDVLGLEACCSHVPVAEFLKLACATRSSRHSRSRWVA